MSRTSILAAFFMILLISCEEGFITDCRDCNPDPVTNATLVIYIKGADYFPSNPLFTLYEGAVEDSVILMQYYVQGSSTYPTYNALLYKDYTATLEFTLDGQQYVTVDAACPQVRYEETACDEPCYYVYDNILDLRLRYR
jgi:hypothetical protein